MSDSDTSPGSIEEHTNAELVKPTLRVQSGWTNAFKGEKVTLRCELAGEDDKWTYIWYKDGGEISAEKQSEYKFDVEDAATFTCKGTRTVGRPQSTEISNSITLTVSESPKPVVKIQPDTHVFMYERVTFRCEFQTEEDSVWTYDWYRDDKIFYPYQTYPHTTHTTHTTHTKQHRSSVSALLHTLLKGNTPAEGGDTVTIRSQRQVILLLSLYQKNPHRL
ncbi:uncharacterized protein LOC124387239 isoform X2 [Silurus meridionalis]|uniref:uncharacterized protein LOC124387239 isoform X2 n=1 Tax=Silurus meridionalis TaxID=175797 RepID=UPI001EE9C22C|nr:uncharacterized protein LOC124387239 isoform X2 [Silurus meridionalis]